jgi:hypothetical protein
MLSEEEYQRRDDLSDRRTESKEFGLVPSR